MTLKDLTGERYSRLTVVGRAPDYISPSGKHLTCWVCRCDCGETVTVTGVHLKSGHTRSCGCYNHDQAVDRSMNPESPGCVKRKSNTFVFEDNEAFCHFNKGGGFSFDADDYDKLKDHCWYDNGHGYAVARGEGGKLMFAHRVITDCPDGKVVDHINHDTLNNRKSNLRACSQAENMKNIKPRKSNRSGVPGVWYEAGSNRWRASVHVNKHTFHLGSYRSLEEAREARKRAEKEFYGDFAYEE